MRTSIRGIGVQVNTRIALDAAGREIGRLAMPQLLTSWGSLYAILKRQFPDEFYHSDASLTRVENLAGGVRAHFANGEQSEGDLLVGADGIRSTVRAQFLPAVVPAVRRLRCVAWIGRGDRAVRRRPIAALFDKFVFCLPPGEQMLGYPVAGAGEQHATRRAALQLGLVSPGGGAIGTGRSAYR